MTVKVGPRRVEVHRPDQKLRIANPGEQLEAPGILANPVPVEALYDREAARPVIFRNLLERQGYASLDDVRAEGAIQGLRKAILAVCAGRGLAVDDELRTALAASGDPAVLESALRKAAIATWPRSSPPSGLDAGRVSLSADETTGRRVIRVTEPGLCMALHAQRVTSSS